MKPLALMAVMTGCATSSMQTNQTITDRVRATVKYSLGTLHCESGWCNVPRKSTYQIKVDIPEKTRHVIVQSCHRFDVYTNPPRPFVFRYTPGFWIENMGSCVLFMTAIRENGSKRLAIADFSGNERAPATVHCNGIQWKSEGSSLCQSKPGLIQSIWFDQPAEAYSSERCTKPRTDGNGSRWELNLSEGLCAYLFVLRDGSRHRFTTWGFTDVAVDP